MTTTGNTTQEAIEDILKLGIFEPGELKPDTHNQTPHTVLKSYQFYNIFYFTNAGLYYLDEETENNLKESADEIHDTEKGKIYCFS